MVDFEGLERLARLRDQGVLSDAEFESEKSKLLSVDQAYEPVYEQEEEPPRRVGKFIGWSLAVLLVGGAAAVFAGGLIDPQSPAEGDSVGAAELGSDESAWRFESGTDPMTDEEVVTAMRRLDAGDYLISAQIRCTGTTKLNYEFDIFRKDQKEDSIGLKANVFGVNRTYELRLDSGQSRVATTQSRYSNVISTDSSDTAQGTTGYPTDDPQVMAAARRILIKVPMQHNDLTFQVPQSSTEIRQFLEGCHKVDPDAGFVQSEQEEVPAPAPEPSVAADEDATSVGEPDVDIEPSTEPEQMPTNDT